MLLETGETMVRQREVDRDASALEGRMRAALWVLWSVRGVRFRHVHALEERLGRDLEDIWRWDGERLERVLGGVGLNEKLAGRIRERVSSVDDPCRQLRSEVEGLAGRVQLLHVRDPDYPQRLLELDDPPVFVYVDGELESCRRPHTLSVVGSRDVRARDVRRAKRIVGEIASAGVVVVSGGALGVDRAVHAAALEVGAETVSLLPGGIDHPTPVSNRDIFERIPKGGALVTEYPVGVEVRPYHFPRRNRLIAALGDATFVVRAGPDSGTMLTAEAARELSRPLCALPGALDEPLAEGCLELLYDGAQLVRDGADVLETYFPELQGQASERGASERRSRTGAGAPDVEDGAEPAPLPEGLSDDAETVVAMLRESGPDGGRASATHVDDLGDAAEWPAGRLQSALLELELHGICEKVGGSQSYRLVRP